MRLSLTLFAVAAIAGLGLSACNQVGGGRAAVGDCYKVVGQDSLGSPDLQKVACSDGEPVELAEAAEAPAAAEAAPAAEAAAPAAERGAPARPTAVAASGTCVPAQPVCCVNACAAPAQTASATASSRTYVATSTVRPKVVAGKAAQRRRSSASSTTVRSRSRQDSSEGLGIEYARVGDEAYHDYRQDQSAYQRSYSGSSSSYGGQTYASPAPRAGYSVSVDSRETQSSRYSEQSASSGGYGASSYGYGSAQGGYAGAVQSGGYTQGGSCCSAGALPGPRGPFDQNGFLTWPGKR